jgi:hypothetical protein
MQQLREGDVVGRLSHRVEAGQLMLLLLLLPVARRRLHLRHRVASAGGDARLGARVSSQLRIYVAPTNNTGKRFTPTPTPTRRHRDNSCCIAHSTPPLASSTPTDGAPNGRVSKTSKSFHFSTLLRASSAPRAESPRGARRAASLDLRRRRPAPHHQRLASSGGGGGGGALRKPHAALVAASRPASVLFSALIARTRGDGCSRLVRRAHFDRWSLARRGTPRVVRRRTAPEKTRAPPLSITATRGRFRRRVARRIMAELLRHLPIG